MCAMRPPGWWCLPPARRLPRPRCPPCAPQPCGIESSAPTAAALLFSRSVLWCLVLVVLVSPAIMALLVPLALAYLWVQARFIATSREIKRLDSVAMSPIYSHFLETLSVRSPASLSEGGAGRGAGGRWRARRARGAAPS